MNGPSRGTLAAALAALGVLAGGCAADAGPSSGVCPSVLEYDGRRYTGHGDLKYDPPLSGVQGSGTFPPCDDLNGATEAETITVHELADLPPERAVLGNGGVFLADGRPFPEKIRHWFTSPGCDTEGTFEVTGQWLGVTTSSPPRFDGDLRAPYRLEVHLSSTDPAGRAYDARTITIRVDEDTDPALGPKDVKTSLWEGGSVTALVHCSGDRFVAEEVRSAPPG